MEVSWKSRSSVVELVVTASLNLMSFTCVLEFVLDPSLHLCDAVLGLDWSRMLKCGLLSFSKPKIHQIHGHHQFRAAVERHGHEHVIKFTLIFPSTPIFLSHPSSKIVHCILTVSTAVPYISKWHSTAVESHEYVFPCSQALAMEYYIDSRRSGRPVVGCSHVLCVVNICPGTSGT